jgi:AcrR family transcriptional regulator
MPQNRPHKRRTGWKRRKSTRPDEILDATAMAVRNQGCDKVRMDDIAKLAGITKGTIYLYFESKDALLNIIKAKCIQEPSRTEKSQYA